MSRIRYLGISLMLAFCSSSAFAGEIPGNMPLRIVGSSAVFPFAATVAEHFHYKTTAPTPLVEAIGTGAGIKLFCSNRQGPDGVMTSRPFTEGEKKKCGEQGVTFEEFKLGQDGLVFIQNKEEPPFSLTLTDLNKALSEKVLERTACVPNPYQTWQDIAPLFPLILFVSWGQRPRLALMTFD
jgi:phosphate transport system substrate-binding protein